MTFDCDPYPVLIDNGVRWVWDYRQIVQAKEKLKVFLRAQLNQEQRAKVMDKFSGFDHELVDELKKPGAFSLELNRFYGNPSKNLKIIGVTGTNGKTSTVTIISYLLSRLGFRALAIGTLGLSTFDERGKLLILGDTGFTSPDLPMLNSLLSQAIKNNFQFVVMEVSSHALSLGRVEGVDFDVAMFNNLDRDHLDFHGSLEKYAEAKKLFFSKVLLSTVKNKKPVALFNADDEYGKKWSKEFEKFYTVKEYSKNHQYEVLSETLSGLEIKVDKKTYKTSLLGGFNAENVMAAISACEVFSDVPADALENFPGIPGRMELVTNNRKFFYIDYAHKPLALEKALEILKKLKRSDQKLWCVFGCGGNRDPGKRPIMGEVAARIADRVIVTSDNPRFENPESIMAQIFAGIPKKFIDKVTAIESRAEAIETAFRHMKESDICLLAGKGPENYQIIGDKKIFFDDRECVSKLTNN